ncbi:hypothetical protein CKO51_21280 [Rhodopirellula sp. SM50]|nr:hypothetical protein CKO51_21280 [Rhodopirellula sp. SM50]
MGSTQLERVDAEPIRKLLRSVSLNRAKDLDALFDEIDPACELDRGAERNLFQAVLGKPNIIRIGLQCTVRLEAHAHAAGVLFTAFGTPGFQTMDRDERNKLLSPADKILTWAVGLDLQRWLGQMGHDLNPEDVLPGGLSEMPTEIIGALTDNQRLFGRSFFLYASAFILLHELGHLKHGHTQSTHENEKVADRFAAEWMSDAASESGNEEFDRLAAIYGIAVALLWLTVFNFYFGKRESKTHPEGYDRLFQVLDQILDVPESDEYKMVWYFVAQMLFIHMWSAGFDFDPEQDAIHMQGDPRDEVNYYIDRISKWDKKREGQSS